MKWHEVALKAGIFVISSFLPIIFLTAIPTLIAHNTISIHTNQTIATNLQGTPTVDPTVTALTKEKLEDENNWLWNNGASLISSALIFIAGITGIFRYLADRKDERVKRAESELHLLQDRQAEREKRSEDRFQSVVEGLGSTSPATQVGSAIMLRTFLNPSYEQFYNQVYDLTVANLRLRDTSEPSEPLSSLSQALITVFKESFVLVRGRLKQDPHVIDAARIQLDNAYLAQADLISIWMPEAFLGYANLSFANLTDANLTGVNARGANLSFANLISANLIKAYLYEANLTSANLTSANLTEAYLLKADFTNAILINAIFTKADFMFTNLTNVNLTNANLTGANLYDAVLTDAILTAADLRGTHPEKAKSLLNTKMHDVKGLGKEQLDACVAMGAIF